MKFLHTSDLHIGASKALPDYLERQSKVIDGIFDVARRHNITTIVIAGDIFDEDVPSKEERDLVQRKLIGYDQAGFNILAIPGNHDMSDMTGYTAIHYLALLHDQGKFINSTIVERTTYRVIDDTLFILVCHTPRKFKEDCARAINDAKDASISLKYKNVVVVVHETIKGSISDTNWRIKGGVDVPKLDYDGEDAQDFDVTYVALGDIHIRQKMAPRTFYCGAPLQIKFGDQWPKGVLIVDTDDPDNPVFEPVASKQMVKATSFDDVPEDCYVKVVTSKTEALGVAKPENVVKVEYEKPDFEPILDLKNGLSLHQLIVEGVSQTLEGDDLAIARREIDNIISQVGQVDE
jgi:exonuclease SbcD